MKPFTMESVLNYRKQLEDIAQQKLSVEQNKEKKLLQKKESVNAELKNLYGTLESLHAEGITVQMLLLYEMRINVVREQLSLLHDELSVLKTQVNKRRKELLKASQDKRILEKLKKQQNLAYKKYMDKKEATMLDETAVLFYDR